MNAQTAKCVVCGSERASRSWDRAWDDCFYECSRCGRFLIDRFAGAVLENSKPTPRQLANLSGWLRENQMACLNNRNIESLLLLPTPTVGERAEKLLVHLAKKFPTPNARVINGNPKKLMLYSSDKLCAVAFCDLYAVSWCESHEEFCFLVMEYLLESKHYLVADEDRGLKISADGWNYLDSLKRNRDSKLVFVAMSFKEGLKFLFDDCIRPAVKDAGYNAERVDTEHHVENINDRMIALINRSRFVVADFTHKSHGVYFEAGYARGLGLTVIWSCREDEVKYLHFDASPFNMLTWTEDKLPDYRERLKDRIGAVIR